LDRRQPLSERGEHPPRRRPALPAEVGLVLKVDQLVAGLTLEPLGPGRYRAPEVETGHAVIFGGQLLAQSLVAAAADHEGKGAKTIHTVFARGAAPGTPLDVTVET